MPYDTTVLDLILAKEFTQANAALSAGHPAAFLDTIGATVEASVALLSGAGAPSGGLGSDGAFYIDTTADAIYGPKTAGAWGSPTSLVGPTGATGATGSIGATGATGSTGAAGATWTSGSGAPSGGAGVNGDFYLRTSNGDVYLKSAGSWSVVANITGPSGSAPTGAANLVLATPNGGSGTASLRALVTADVPAQTIPSGSAIPKADGAGKLAAGWVPTLNQNTTGTAGGLSVTNDVAHGGTGAATLAAHGVVVGAGTSAVTVTGAGAAGQVLTSNGASADPTFQAPPATGRYKSTIQPVSNSTAYEDDDELSVDVPAAGNYLVEIQLECHCSNVSHGFAWTVGGSATRVSEQWFLEVYGHDSLAWVLVDWGAAGSLNSDSDYSLRLRGSVAISAAGTICFAFAQAVAGISNTSVLAGGTMVVTLLVPDSG